MAPRRPEKVTRSLFTAAFTAVKEIKETTLLIEGGTAMSRCASIKNMVVADNSDLSASKNLFA